jgi:acylpyruvate hydrolase
VRASLSGVFHGGSLSGVGVRLRGVRSRWRPVEYASNLIGPTNDILLPPEAEAADYEGEMALVIGRAGRRISEAEAMDHVLGYCVANDVSMRDHQYKSHQWMQGKAWDDSTPLGPAIVTPDEVDPSATTIRTVLNGEIVQASTLEHLIFSIPRLTATISESSLV